MGINQNRFFSIDMDYFSKFIILEKTNKRIDENLFFFLQGLHLEIVGPTLKILAEQTGVDLTNISTILASRNGGYMIANLIGALIQNIVKKSPEAFLASSFLIASIGLKNFFFSFRMMNIFIVAVLATPFIRNLTLLSIVFFFQGISQGTTDLGLL